MSIDSKAIARDLAFADAFLRQVWDDDGSGITGTVMTQGVLAGWLAEARADGRAEAHRVLADTLRTMMGATAAEPYIRAITGGQ